MTQSRLEQELELSRSLTLAVARAADADAGLRAALRIIGERGGWPLARAWVYDPKADRLDAGPLWHAPAAPEPAHELLEQTGSWDAPLWMEDLSGEEDDPRARAAVAAGQGVAFAVPVLTEGRVVAVLQFFAEERHDSDEVWLEVACSVAAQLGTFIEYKRTESDLRASELRFHAVAASPGAAIVSANVGGAIVYANASAHQMFGWPAGELEGSPLTVLMPQGLRGAHEQGFERYLKTREPRILDRTVELAGQRRDGSEFPLELSLTSWEVDGRTYFTSVLRDISKRARAEDELRRSEASLAAAHSLARLGTWEWDVVRDTFNLSAELAAILGVDEQAGVTWEGFLELVHPEDRSNLQDYADAALSTGEPGPYMHRVVRPDGEVRVLQGRGMVEKDPVGRPDLLRGVSHDVTDLKTFEERLLQSERLESLGRLAAGVSHDFNNLLAVILSYAALVDAKLPEPDPLRKDVGEIRRAAERATSLTQQLLVFGQGEVARREVVDLNGLIVDLASLLRQALPGHSSLELGLAAGELPVEVNPSQIEQILLNLVFNARDAMPKGGAVRIETRVGGRDHHVELRVRDEGEGMTRDVRARAFEPFFTTKARGEGTGLGLATVYGVVAQSEGSVELGSAPGKGTEVVIRLPPASRAAPVVQAASPPAEVRLLEGEGSSVLLVETDDPVRAVAARILSEAGHRVLAAADPLAALALAERDDRGLDLLVTGAVMPKLSGPELADRLRERHPQLAVLYMSGHPQALEEGGPVLSKPFTPDDLLSAVQAATATPKR